MLFERHERDGEKLLDVTTDQLWLVYAGRRHYITSEDVFKSLFRPRVQIKKPPRDAFETIKRGPDLLLGTCLARRDTGITIHLLAVHPKRVVLHPIPSTDVFDKYGFDYDACRIMQSSVFDKMRTGEDLA